MVLAALACMAAAASDPSERLPDPGQEARARHLFQQYRCVVCQNESIDESQADIAHDLRQVIRAQIVQGRTDDQIRHFLVDRYGEFILLKPRFTLGNAALWLTPVVIVLAGGAFFAVRGRARTTLEPALTAEEERRLNALTREEADREVSMKNPRAESPGVKET